MSVLLLFRLCFVATLAVCSFSRDGARLASSKDNIVLFLTDDQDMSTLPYFPAINHLFAASPIRFVNTFTTTPVCCPSRSVFLSGRLLHNNGAINNSVSGNCGSFQWQADNEKRTFAYRMQQVGYDSFYAGKYLNTYLYDETGGPRVPLGWSDFHGTGCSEQYFYNMSDNGVRTEHLGKYPDDYMPRVVEKHALNFLANRTASGRPFVMVLAFTACHMPDDAEPQHQSKFADARAPRNPNYNAGSSNKEWIVSWQPPLDANEQSFTDLLYRKRLQTLSTVEQVVGHIVDTLKAMGVYERTHLFYASDNGFHTGQYRMVMDKRLPYDSDVRVPILWLPAHRHSRQLRQGPLVVSQPIALVDLAPTFSEIAGVQFSDDDFDGVSLLRFLEPSSSKDENAVRNVLLIEYRGEGDYDFKNPLTDPESCGGLKNVVCSAVSPRIFPNEPRWQGSDFCFCQDARNNSYNCMRLIDESRDQLYCEFTIVDTQPCEFYDLIKDPWQLDNKCENLAPDVRKTLNDQLSKLSKCHGITCRVSSIENLELNV